MNKYLFFSRPSTGTLENALESFFNTIKANGQIGVIPKDSQPYVISRKITVNVASDEFFELDIAAGCVLQSVSGLNKPLLSIQGGGNGLFGSGAAKITGAGKIDNSKGVHISGNQSNTGIEANFLRHFAVSGPLHLYAGDHYNHMNGDSGITAGSCMNISIRDGVIFEGWPDVGIYLTGDNDNSQQEGNSAVVSGCVFKCNKNDVTSKRRYKSAKITDNYFEKSEIGVSTLGADTSSLAGNNVVITGNSFHDTARPITVRMSDGAVVSGNQFINWGTTYDGTDLGKWLRAVLVQGSKGCVITGNVFDSRDSDPSYAIEVSDYTYNGITYKAGGCQVSNTHMCDGSGATKTFADVNASIPSDVYINSCGCEESKYVNDKTKRTIFDNEAGTKTVHCVDSVMNHDNTLECCAP